MGLKARITGKLKEKKEVQGYVKQTDMLEH